MKEDDKKQKFKNIKLKFSPHDKTLVTLAAAHHQVSNYVAYIASYTQDINTIQDFYGKLSSYWHLLKPLCGENEQRKVDAPFFKIRKYVFNKEYTKSIPYALHDELLKLYDIILEIAQPKGALYMVTKSNWNQHDKLKEQILG